ncbi:MAG: VWA-like domain-containing protein, partial [Vagococcus sp.]|nr:VWA-like domain-containing protein [Vagococcus sp.]
VWNLACDLWVNSRLKDRQKEYRDNRNISYDLYKDELFSTDRRILNLSVDDIYSEFMEQYTTQVGDSGDEVGPGGDDDEIILESGSNTIKLGDYNPDMIKPEDVGESSADLVDQISEMNGASYVHSELVGTSTKLLSEQEIGMQRAQTKWYKYFDRHLKKVFNHDTSYTTPDRNLLYTRRIYKGPMKATSDKLNQVIVAMDCSSSVWDDKESMEKFWFHINNIMKKYQAEGKVLLWDGEVGLELELAKFRVNKKYDLPKGGTDPISVFNYISKNRIKYDVLVILTDGYFKEKDFEKIESLDDKKTIWVISGKHKAFKRLEEHTDKAKVAKL